MKPIAGMFFILLRNKVRNAIVALELCRNRDVVEKAGENLKKWLNVRQDVIVSDQSVLGKLFNAFIARSYLYLFGEILKKQSNLYENFGSGK